ncbi:transposase [Streptomyces globisporus]|uniref:transposase n=1 Tax=Streptomyces globisporus TaxID=1908 RepID=UPI00381B5BA0
MDDELWALIEPLLPPWPERSPRPRPASDRLCLQGVLFVLCNDIAWQLLPLELGFGSGQTCWRRPDPAAGGGSLRPAAPVLLAELNAAGELDRSRACVDGSHARAKKGAPTPARRRSTGGKRAPPDLRSPAAQGGPADTPSPCSATPLLFSPSRVTSAPRPEREGHKYLHFGRRGVSATLRRPHRIPRSFRSRFRGWCCVRARSLRFTGRRCEDGRFGATVLHWRRQA